MAPGPPGQRSATERSSEILAALAAMKLTLVSLRAARVSGTGNDFQRSGVIARLRQPPRTHLVRVLLHQVEEPAAGGPGTLNPSILGSPLDRL